MPQTVRDQLQQPRHGNGEGKGTGSFSPRQILTPRSLVTFEPRVAHSLSGFSIIWPRIWCSVCFGIYSPRWRLRLHHGRAACLVPQGRWGMGRTRGRDAREGTRGLLHLDSRTHVHPQVPLTFLQEVGGDSWLHFRVAGVFVRAPDGGIRGIGV